MKKDTEQHIQHLQILEQNMQNLLMQKQQFQAQHVEIESAIAALDGKKEGYRIIGSVMVLLPQDQLLGELKDKAEQFSIRIKSLEKQEEKLKQQVKQIQAEVMSQLKQEGK
ncbi:MAG TPA: prefoldin subunit [Candidatus Nanoarchaeia archaeon]|nr:prefoldin subunit [Candidatus Nanoarchaeia archaeon]